MRISVRVPTRDSCLNVLGVKRDGIFIMGKTAKSRASDCRHPDNWGKSRETKPLTACLALSFDMCSRAHYDLGGIGLLQCHDSEDIFTLVHEASRLSELPKFTHDATHPTPSQKIRPRHSKTTTLSHFFAGRQHAPLIRCVPNLDCCMPCPTLNTFKTTRSSRCK